MLLNWKTGLVFCLLFFSLSDIRAAEMPASAISGEAGIVVRLKQPQLTMQKITGLTNQVDESVSSLLGANLRTIVGRSLFNPTLVGVDTKRDLGVGVFFSPTEKPELLFVVPVADGAELKNALGAQFKTAQHENWLIYSKQQQLVDLALENIKAEDKSYQKQLSSESRDLFSGGDLSIYINSQKLVELFQPQLKQAEQQVDQRLNELSKVMNTTPGVNVKPILGFYSALAKGGLQAVNDSKSYTTAVRFSEQGVALDSRFEVKANSKTDELFHANPPQAFEQLGHFPANQLVYIAGAGNTDALITWGMNFTAQMFDETSQNAQARDDFTKLVKEIRSLQFGSFYFSFELGKLSQGVLNAYTISEVTPSGQMRKLTHQMMEMMKNISLPGLKQEITFTPDAEQVGSVPVDLTVIKQEVDPASDPLQIQKRMLEILYGPSGITNRMAYPEGKVLQAMGATASMQKFLEALDAPEKSTLIAENQPSFRKARKQGSQKANILALIDVPGTVMKIVNILAEIRQQDPIFTEELASQQGIKKAYLTFSLSTDQESLNSKAFIPVENLQSGFKIFSLISRQK